MRRIYEYADSDFNYHHSIDEHPDPAQYPMHAHETHELFYFISGHGSYLVEGNPYPLRPGDLMLMRSQETHKLQILPDRPYERLALSFNESAVRRLDPDGRLTAPFWNRRLGQQNLYTAAELHGSCVAECLRRMETLSSEVNPGLIFQSFLYPILCEIECIFLKRDPDTGRPADLAAEIVEYVNLHLCDELSLDIISSRFYISKTHLNRLFKQAVGSTVWEYITIKRLMLCRSKIAEGIPAYKAAAMCGFRDYSTFFRGYRKLFGTAPTEDHGEVSAVDFTGKQTKSGWWT